MDWFRWWHDSAIDPKFSMIAKELSISVAAVLGAWIYLLEVASKNDDRGSLENLDEEVMRFALGLDDHVTPCNAMKRRGLLHVTDGKLRITNWEKRQPKREREDKSADRVKKHRANKHAGSSDVTPCNANATQETPRGEEIREEVNLKPSNPNGLDVASDAERSDCPHQKIIALYHEVLPMCPQVRDWTPARATQLRARWNEDEKRQNLEYWKRFFEYVKTCDFLVGRAGKTPFFADLEWLTKSGNFTKVREEKYANKAKS